MESSEESGQRLVARCQEMHPERVALVRARKIRNNQAEDLLVATEQAGAKTGRQIGPIAPRAHKAVQPALGQMRFGTVAQHFDQTPLLNHYNLCGEETETHFWYFRSRRPWRPLRWTLLAAEYAKNAEEPAGDF